MDRARHDLGTVAIDVETTSLDPMLATLCGFSLALAPNEACYVPLAHRAGGDGTGGLFGGGLAPDQIAERDALEALRPLLERSRRAQDRPQHQVRLADARAARHRVAPYDDTMLMSYVLDAGRADHGLESLVRRHFNHELDRSGRVARFRQVAGHVRLHRDRQGVRTCRRARRRDPAAVAASATAAGRRAHDDRLRNAGAPAGGRAGAHGAARHLDRPAGAVAAVRRLRATRRRPRSRNSASSPASRFNPGSPKQLGDILFGKMGLPGGTKTKTGQWSTGARVLDELAEQGHQLPQKILEWRQVTKLKSTYTDALPGYVNPTPTACTPATRWRRRPPAGSRPPSRTCRTSRSAPRKAARSGAPSSPRPATSWSRPTIRRSNCGCSPRSPISARCARRSATASTFTP